MDKNMRIAENTEYFKIHDDNFQTIGVSHHSIGLGKLKVFDKVERAEYGVPLSDILSKSLSDWRIEKK